jgi:hypothetical protein
VWGAEDDMLVRKTAVRLVSKKWEVLKLCKNVIDEQASMLNEMKMKEKIKENVCWNDEDERKYCEWKIINVKYMSLKESKLKENVRLNVFEHFCERKGLNRKKGIWETKVDDEIRLKESELKDILNRKKLKKSKRKKIELMKECKQKLFEMVDNWKETPGIEIERTYKKLKASARKERIVEILGRKRNPEKKHEMGVADLPGMMTTEENRRQMLAEDDPGTLAQEVDIVIEDPVEEDPADVIVVETPVEDARPSSSLNNLKMTPTRAPRKTKPGRLCQEDSIRKNMKRRGQGGSSPVATHFETEPQREVPGSTDRNLTAI